jgi:hypothetical protein
VGETTSVSTNYLTGARITTTTPAKGRATTQRSTVAHPKKFIEDVDQDAMESTE